MKRFIPLFFLLSLVLASDYGWAQSEMQPVNSVLGDTSFFWKFGRWPGLDDADSLRIATHLEYVEFRLRSAKPPQNSSPVRRMEMIRNLREYRLNGLFPENRHSFTHRFPCFIDDKGTICAVGYLVEQTAGREVAEDLNAEFQYDLIDSMKSPVLTSWVQNSGLTLRECAMIQPTYGPSYSGGLPKLKEGETIDHFFSEGYKNLRGDLTGRTEVSLVLTIGSYGRVLSPVKIEGELPKKLKRQIKRKSKKLRFTPSRVDGERTELNYFVDLVLYPANQEGMGKKNTEGEYKPVPKDENSPITISGMVYDLELGAPLIGATIVDQKRNVGVMADLDGKFSLKIPPGNGTDVKLEVRYLGYETQIWESEIWGDHYKNFTMGGQSRWGGRANRARVEIPVY